MWDQGFCVCVELFFSLPVAAGSPGGRSHGKEPDAANQPDRCSLKGVGFESPNIIYLLAPCSLTAFLRACFFSKGFPSTAGDGHNSYV